MRGKFNTTCDVYTGPGTPSPGMLLGTYPCRLVVEDGITTVGTGSPPIPRYLTIDAYQPRGAWTSAKFGMDASLSDWVAVPSGAFPQWWVLYTDIINWKALTPYWRSYLVPLPLPDYSEGGLIANSSAGVTVIHPSTSSGGLLANSSAYALVAMNFTGSGGAKLNASALIELFHGIIASGGAKLNASALMEVFQDIIATGGAKLNASAQYATGHAYFGQGGAMLNSDAMWATHGSGQPPGPPPLPTGAVFVTEGTAYPTGIAIVTTAAHALTTGDKVQIIGCTATVEANGLWIVDVLSSFVFGLAGSSPISGIHSEPGATYTQVG